MEERNTHNRPQILVQVPSDSLENLNIANEQRSASLPNLASNLLRSPSPGNAPSSTLIEDENSLSEAELRRLYDDEEIQHFLTLFSDYVTEVVLHPLKQDCGVKDASEVRLSSGSADLGIVESLSFSDSSHSSLGDRGGELQDGQESGTPLPLPRRCTQPSLERQHRHSLSETIAFNYVLPFLPPAKPRPDKFTIGRLRIAAQRLYLVSKAPYLAFFNKLIYLATWKDKTISLAYCILFWILWYQDMLLAALFSRILYTLLRRKVLPYPTATELRERRKEVAMADELGAQLQTRLRSSSSDLAEIWRAVRALTRPNKQNSRQHNKTMSQAFIGSESAVQLPMTDAIVSLETTNKSREEQDMRKTISDILNDLADFHERIRNLFLPRSPRSSSVLACWWRPIGSRRTPIIAALPRSDRARISILFENSPTDAEYAMELISKRIARGEEIRPIPRRKTKKHRRQGDSTRISRLAVPSESGEDSSQTASENEDAEFTTARPRSSSQSPESTMHGEIDWRKWGKKAASMKAWVDRRQGSDSRQFRDVQAETEAHTYLAYQKSTPGLLVLTSSMLLYTPITSSRPKLEVALSRMRGVKKMGFGAVPGLSVKWEQSKKDTSSTDSRATEILEEKFQWVGGRDELFARLVGWGGRKWLRV